MSGFSHRGKEDEMIEAIVAAIGVLTLLVVVARTVRIVPQARAGVVERLGRYSRTLTPGS
jgi:regulator of protease activity HflC (stomatin/prohibitin superfamily)